MAALATVQRLPFELISKVMDNVNISELIWFSHVCSAWRRAAYAHPTFWRDIKMDVGKSAVDFFQARLCAHTSGINLNVVCFSFIGPPDEYHLRQFRSIVLPAVRRNLLRINHLDLGFTDNYSSYIRDALALPAPMLQDLFLTNYPTDWTILNLPHDFLGGHAPLLKNAHLMQVALPGPARTVTAFQNIESLSFDADWKCVLPDILVHFPALKHLRFSVFAFLEAQAPVAFPHHPLTTLDVHVKNENYAPFFNAFYPSDLASITHLTCYADGATRWIQTFLGAIEGPLTLTIRDFGGFGADDVSVELSTADPAQKRTRTFHVNQVHIQGEEDVWWWHVQEELFAPQLLARVSRFRLLSKHAGMVPEIGDELPACETLELCFDQMGCHGHPLVARLNYNALREPYALQFPAVRTIICTASDDAPVGVTISANDLSALLGRVIQARPSPLNVIELAGLQLTGDVEALEREYGCAVLYRTI